jgi:hypothetical protein
MLLSQSVNDFSGNAVLSGKSFRMMGMSGNTVISGSHVSQGGERSGP